MKDCNLTVGDLKVGDKFGRHCLDRTYKYEVLEAGMTDEYGQEFAIVKGKTGDVFTLLSFIDVDEVYN